MAAARAGGLMYAGLRSGGQEGIGGKGAQSLRSAAGWQGGCSLVEGGEADVVG